VGGHEDAGLGQLRQMRAAGVALHTELSPEYRRPLRAAGPSAIDDWLRQMGPTRGGDPGWPPPDQRVAAAQSIVAPETSMSPSISRRNRWASMRRTKRLAISEPTMSEAPLVSPSAMVSKGRAP